MHHTCSKLDAQYTCKISSSYLERLLEISCAKLGTFFFGGGTRYVGTYIQYLHVPNSLSSVGRGIRRNSRSPSGPVQTIHNCEQSADGRNAPGRPAHCPVTRSQRNVEATPPPPIRWSRFRFRPHRRVVENTRRLIAPTPNQLHALPRSGTWIRRIRRIQVPIWIYSDFLGWNSYKMLSINLQ